MLSGCAPGGIGAGTRRAPRRACVRRPGASPPGCRSRRRGDLLDAVGGVLDQTAGVFQTDAVDVAARRHAGLGLEGPGEVAGREPGAGREDVHRQVRAGMFGDPLLDLAQRLPLRGLCGELGTELGLVSRSPQEDDEMAGDGEGDLAADVLLDEREGQVDAGRDAGRGGELSVTDEDGVRVHLHGRVVAGEFLAHRPVTRHPSAVQQARLGEQECSGAHRDEALGPRAVLPQPGHQARVGAPGARTARDQQDVRGRCVGEAVVRDQGEAAGGAHGPAVPADGADAVRAWAVQLGAVEDLHRARDVEALHVVEEDDQGGLHAFDSWRSDRWPQ